MSCQVRFDFPAAQFANTECAIHSTKGDVFSTRVDDYRAVDDSTTAKPTKWFIDGRIDPCQCCCPIIRPNDLLAIGAEDRRGSKRRVELANRLQRLTIQQQ